MMRFSEIRERAIARKGEAAYLAALPAPPATPLRDLPDDRLLSELTKRVFQAGFNWSVEDTVGLFALLKKRGARLGGTTGQYALRFAGYDALILSRSVVAALNAQGVIDGAATSKSAQAKAQAAFNTWHEESGETYAVISRTLALSVPD